MLHVILLIAGPRKLPSNAQKFTTDVRNVETKSNQIFPPITFSCITGSSKGCENISTQEIFKQLDTHLFCLNPPTDQAARSPSSTVQCAAVYLAHHSSLAGGRASRSLQSLNYSEKRKGLRAVSPVHAQFMMRGAIWVVACKWRGGTICQSKVWLAYRPVT